MRHALIRRVSPRINACELTHQARTPIDVTRARAQHAAYADILSELDCRVAEVPDVGDFPDGVFVEDTAIVLPEMAVITRPGAASRRGELAAVERVLAEHRRMVRIEDPGTLEGGDVLVVGKTLYVGQSSRTNAAGIAQLAALVDSAGYVVQPVAVSGCLHLKSAVSRVGTNRVLIHRPWVDEAAFAGVDVLDVHPDEPHAANALLVGDTVLCAEAFVQTRAVLDRHGIDVRSLAYDELAKAEGALTCCSIIFEA